VPPTVVLFTDLANPTSNALYQRLGYRPIEDRTVVGIHVMKAGAVLSVNLAVPERSTAKHVGITGINKRPVDHPVAVRAPGPKTIGLHSGLVGDQIFDIEHHGGDDQAVYAYAREDYDWWERMLDRRLPGGMFGDNLTTVDVDGRTGRSSAKSGASARIWCCSPRSGGIPCATFQAKMGEPHWVKRFTRESRPGAYLRVSHARLPFRPATGSRWSTARRTA
jgi:MOSC domain-containing protein YiiM